jgi:hypothetical protein
MSLNNTTPRRRVVEATSRGPRVELHAVHVVIENDPDPDLSDLDQDSLDAYERGELTFMGVRAEADVSIGGIAQTLFSTGVPGVASDAEDVYLDEVIAQEWAALRGVLKAVGVSTEQLPLEVQHEWIEWQTEDERLAIP